MDGGLIVAGVISVAMAFGHATIGLRWVLPQVNESRLARTPLGPAKMSEGMLLVTWHIVTIFAIGSGGLLLNLAWAPDADPRTILLRWFAGIWIAATVMAGYVTRPRLRNLMRLPVPILWVVIAGLCWWAST